MACKAPAFYRHRVVQRHALRAGTHLTPDLVAAESTLGAGAGADVLCFRLCEEIVVIS